MYPTFSFGEEQGEQAIAHFIYAPRQDLPDSMCALVEILWRRPRFLDPVDQEFLLEQKDEFGEWVNETYPPNKFMMTAPGAHIWQLRLYGEEANKLLIAFKLRWGDVWDES